MKPLNSYDRKGILSEEVFVEIFEQDDAIRRAQMLLSFQDRAKELGVKGQFDTMVKAFEKTEKEMQKKQQQSQTLNENWTNFTGKYDSMKCGSWLAADNGIRIFNKDYSNEVIVCYHPILPIGRLRNLETGEEQIRLAYKRNHPLDGDYGPKRYHIVVQQDRLAVPSSAWQSRPKMQNCW